MIRILYIVSTLKHAGPTNQLFNLIRFLDRRQFEPVLITLSPEPSDSAWENFEALGVRMHSLGLSRLQGFFRVKKHLKTLVDQIAPDVIHTQGIRADMVNAAMLGHIPSHCTSRNDPFADYPAKFGKLRGALMARQHSAAFRKLHVVACSKTLQAQLRGHGIHAQAIQNGVDAERFQPGSAHQKILLRQQLGLPQDATLIVSAGSLIPRKDMPTIITAFDQANLPHTKLIILGDGPQMEALRGKAGESILFPGMVANVADYLGAADLFVSASLSEGLPNTVLEAMACGLPCLLSDIPSHRELFEHHTALFFPCGDVAALADKFVRTTPETMADLGRLSRQIVEQGFSAFKMSESYQALYQEHLQTSLM